MRVRAGGLKTLLAIMALCALQADNIVQPPTPKPIHHPILGINRIPFGEMQVVSRTCSKVIYRTEQMSGPLARLVTRHLPRSRRIYDDTTMNLMLHIGCERFDHDFVTTYLQLTLGDSIQIRVKDVNRIDHITKTDLGYTEVTAGRIWSGDDVSYKVFQSDYLSSASKRRGSYFLRTGRFLLESLFRSDVAIARNQDHHYLSRPTYRWFDTRR